MEHENALDFYTSLFLTSPKTQPRREKLFCFIAVFLSIKRPNVFTATECVVGLEWTCLLQQMKEVQQVGGLMLSELQKQKQQHIKLLYNLNRGERRETW